MDRDPTSTTMSDMAAAIAARRITARQVVEAHLARIEALDDALAAFVRVDHDAALRSADRADQAVARGDRLGSLHGVPLAHKDMFYRPDRPVANGSKIRADFVADNAATVLDRLDGAGAINIGALAMVEFAMGPHGYNAHLRQCRNPWDLDHVPCGSSSGSGVAVAARLVPASLGSDTGGSIRCPASANGVVGLQPTWSRVSRHGVMPMSVSLDVVGPLARTARDCALMMNAIAGHDPLDHTSSRHQIPDYQARLDLPLDGIRIGLPDGYFGDGVSADVAASLRDASEVMRSLGAELVEIATPSIIGDAADLHPLVMKAEGAANHHLWMRHRPDDYSKEVRQRLQAGFFIPATDYIQALKLRAALLQEFNALVFSKVDVLFTPVLPKAAPTIAETLTTDGPAYLDMVVSLTRNTKIGNFLGLPGISVPCGFTGDGLPTSFQLIGRPFSEALLLQLANRYQGVTDWHERAPPVLQTT